MRSKLLSVWLCLLVTFCACNNGQAGDGAPVGTGWFDGGCKPLTGSSTTLADIEKEIERTKDDMHEGGKKLTKGAACGEYEVAHVGNGFASHTYYLKDGVVVGIRYSDDGGGKNCYGVIPSCK